MNSTLTPHSTLSPASHSARTDDNDDVDIGHYLDVLSSNKWLVAAITALTLLIGTAYALLTRPVYESNLLIQVEDGEGASKSFLGEAGALFDVKAPATAEMEILRSRKVLGGAVDANTLYVNAHPRYIPLIGGWLARRATQLSNPGFLGMGGFVSGTERIVVDRFDVPHALEPSTYVLTAGAGGEYTLAREGWPRPLTGKVGVLLEESAPQGPVALLISQLDGKLGAQFIVERFSRLATIEDLQTRLSLSEKGRQSNVINAALQDVDAVKVTEVLNAIGAQYVRQNVERKAAEAQKTLAFLDAQLPQYRKQLENSEELYNQYRNRKGTVAFDEEAKLVLGTAVDRQTKLLEAQQRRRELEPRFTASHPMMQTLDSQIAALTRDIGEVQAKIKSLPAVQQDAVRMQRDVTVNTSLYQSLVNQALQLQLVKEGKVGNVRLLDSATVPEKPVKPRRAMIVAVSLLVGLFLGILAAFVRNALVEQRIRDPHDVELESGLPVFSTIPVSSVQKRIAERRLTGATGVRLLAIEQPDDPAVESLRSLRTAMQFAMLEAPNNRVLITGATPGVGKSFVAANFAALMASAGKRTLLIDADLRRGHIHQYLGLQRHGGLSELIAGSLTVQQTVHRNVVANLDLLATGQLPPNPGELLLSDSFTAMLLKLSEQYDLVVIDTPPVLVAADTSAVAKHAGTVLLVARAHISTMGELKESTRRLALGGKAATGVLLNAMESSRQGYGAYKYGRYRYTNYNYESVLPEEA